MSVVTPEKPVNRPLTAVLETPLSPYEIGYRITESGHVTGRVVITEDALAQDNGSAEEDLSGLLLGNVNLIDISTNEVGTRPSWKYSAAELADPSLRMDDYEDDLIVEVTGGIDGPYDNFATDEERAEYRRGYEDAHRLVCIIMLQGQDYESAVDAINTLGGSTRAAVEYLAQWDNGGENDNDAEAGNSYDSLVYVEAMAHHREEHGGITYWLVADHTLRHYALYRQPLN